MFSLSRFSLRGLSVIAALAMALLLGALAAVMVYRSMGQSDLEESASLAVGSASVAAKMVDRSLSEGSADLRQLRDLVQDARLWNDLPRLQRWMDTLQGIKPMYSWIGFADTSGKVVAASRALALGADVSKRIWFREGLQKLALGDLHEAFLLQEVLQPLPEGELWRFVDVSMPVKDARGQVLGVLAIHLSWPWVRESVQVATSALPYKGSVWVVGRDDKARLSGDGDPTTDTLKLKALALARSGQSGWLTETWADGKRYITAYFPLPSERAAQDLGWVILVRAPADELAPGDQEDLYDTLMLLAAGIALITLTAWAGATVWLRPLRNFVQRIGQIRDGQRPPLLPKHAPQEFHKLNLAILRLVDQLEDKEAQTQRNLETVQNSFRAVGGSLPGTLMTFRLNASDKPEFLFLGGSMELYFGVEEEKILADGQAWKTHVSAKDADTYKDQLARTLQEGAKSVSLPIRVRGGDGKERTLQLTVVQRDNERERIFDAIALDVTELYQARRAAEQANRAKSDFLATMSHELRTPLNAILGFAQVLENELDNPRQRQQVRYMRETGETLTRILNDVLDIAKIEAGKFDLDPRPFAMEQVIDSCASVFRVVSAEKGVAFDVQLPDTLPRLVGDPVRLRQILHNLLSNAFKFTASGAVALRVRLDRLAPGPEGGQQAELTVEVHDTGLGMSEEQLERLFQRFEQASRSISGQYGGTGLGLAIVKALVENMQGRIEVSSRPGEGTRLTLQLAFAVVQAEPEQAADSQAPEEPLHVLVVDDFHINRAVLRALLEKRGHRVSEAEDGVQAIEKVSALHPDLVLMDLDMPNMDGLEATRRIRRLPVDEQAMTPVYAITGKAFEEDIAQTRAAGMNGHLSKPVQLDELIPVLRAALSQGTQA